VPAFSPPTWAVLVFFKFRYPNLPVAALIVGGATAAAAGRLARALAFRAFHAKLPPKRQEAGGPAAVRIWLACVLRARRHAVRRPARGHIATRPNGSRRQSSPRVREESSDYPRAPSWTSRAIMHRSSIATCSSLLIVGTTSAGSRPRSDSSWRSRWTRDWLSRPPWDRGGIPAAACNWKLSCTKPSPSKRTSGLTSRRRLIWALTGTRKPQEPLAPPRCSGSPSQDSQR